MNAAETIQAALDKLTRLRDNSVPGPWVWEEPSNDSYPNGDESLLGKGGAPVLVGWGYDASGINSEPADRDLIITLHATIDAQLSILALALSSYWSPGAAPDDWETFEDGKAVLDLARAILGEQPND